MTKARAWLVEKGLAKDGRGRLSTAAKTALNEAVASGMTFSDYKVDADGKGAVKQAGSPQTEIGEVPEPWRPESTKFVFADTGKPCGWKNACNLCGYSLGWCPHPEPVVYSRKVVVAS